MDSDVLEEQISLQKTLLASAEAQFKSASKMKDPIAKQETQLRAGQSMARLNAKINELEEKLEKLLAFDGASAKIFSEIAALKQAVDQGLAMVRSDFKGASSIPTIKGRSLPWVKTINASVAKFSDDGEEAAKLLDNQILKEEMKKYNEKIEVTDRDEQLKINEDDIVTQNIIVEMYNSIASLPTLETTEGAKRLGMIVKMYPDAFIKKILKSEEFWTLADKLPSKYQTTLINTLARYEKLGDTAAVWKFLPKINTIGKAYEMYNKAVSPFKTFVSETLKNSTLYQNIKLIKFGKVLGKVTNIATYADLAVTFGSSSANEFGKTGSVGKAAIGGAIDTVKSIGPFEGMVIGASIGNAVPVIGTTAGTIIGGAVGLLNKGVQMVWPSAYDNAKKWSYEQYDKAAKVGKSLISDSKNFINSSSKRATRFIENIGASIKVHKIPFIGGT